MIHRSVGRTALIFIMGSLLLSLPVAAKDRSLKRFHESWTEGEVTTSGSHGPDHVTEELGPHRRPKAGSALSSRRRRRSKMLQQPLSSNRRQRPSRTSALSRRQSQIPQQPLGISRGVVKSQVEKQHVGLNSKGHDHIVLPQTAGVAGQGKTPSHGKAAHTATSHASSTGGGGSGRKAGPGKVGASGTAPAGAKNKVKSRKKKKHDHDRDRSSNEDSESEEKQRERKRVEAEKRQHRWLLGHHAVKNNQLYWIWPTVFVFGVLGLFFLLFLGFIIFEVGRFFKRGIHLDGRSSFWGYLMYRASLILQEVQYSTLYMLIAFTFFVLTCSITAQMCWPKADYKLLDTFEPPDLPEATWDAWKWVIAPDAGGAQRTPYGRFVGVITCLGGLTVFALLISVISTEFAQWLQNIRDGVGPVIEGGHVLVLGWSENGNLLIQELAKAQDNKRTRGTKSVVVILAHSREHVLSHISHILPLKGIHVTVRQGSAYRKKHLENVSAASAAAIIVLSPHYAERDVADYRTCATLRVLKEHNWPASGHTVALSMQHHSLNMVMAASGPRTSVLEPYTIGGQMIRKCIMTPAWPLFLHEVFGHGSQALSISNWNGTPKPFHEMQGEFLEAIPIGLIAADGKVILCPKDNQRVHPGEGVLLVQATLNQALDGDSHNPTLHRFSAPLKANEKVRIVIVGWNRMGPQLIKELDGHVKGEISIISRSDKVKRECQMVDFNHPFKMRITHYECSAVLKGCLEEAKVASADIMVFLAEESFETEEPRLIDEQTTGSVLSAMQVLSARPEGSGQPRIFAEVLDREAQAHLHRVGCQGAAQLASRVLSVGLADGNNPSAGLTTINSAQLLYRISSMIIGEHRLFPVLHSLSDLVLEEIALPAQQGGGSFLDAKSAISTGASSSCVVGWKMQGRWEFNPKDKMEHNDWTRGDRLLVIKKEEALGTLDE